MLNEFIRLLEAAADGSLAISCGRWHHQLSCNQTRAGDTGSALVQKEELLKLLSSALGISLEIWHSPSQFNVVHELNAQGLQKFRNQYKWN